MRRFYAGMGVHASRAWFPRNPLIIKHLQGLRVRPSLRDERDQ